MGRGWKFCSMEKMCYNSLTRLEGLESWALSMENMGNQILLMCLAVQGVFTGPQPFKRCEVV